MFSSMLITNMKVRNSYVLRLKICGKKSVIKYTFLVKTLYIIFESLIKHDIHIQHTQTHMD